MVRFSKLEFIVFPQVCWKDRADKLSRLRPVGEDTSTSVDGLPVCDVDDTSGTNENISYLQVFSDCNVKCELITGKPSDEPIDKGETNVWTVQPAKQTIRSKVRTMKDLTVEETKDV